MPKAMLITMTVGACLVVMIGCRDQPVDAPAEATKADQRTTRIWSPPAAPTKTDQDASTRPDVEPAEPAMSLPPGEDARQRSTPAPAPRAPTPPQPPSQYTDGCGRPLIT